MRRPDELYDTGQAQLNRSSDNRTGARRWSVAQDGNAITLGADDETRFAYEVDGVDLPPLGDLSFAVWHALPSSMLLGRDILIDGPVDPAVMENAERLSRIWSLWKPGELRPVTVKASTAERPKRPERPALVFYSGGVDSTYYLTSKGRCETMGHVLTIHGMDYRPENDTGFQALVDKTGPFLQALNYRRVTIRTDAAKQGRADVMHGMTLSGCADLLSNLFGSAELAADYTLEQEMMVWPWGTNHVTNRFLRGSDWRIDSVSGDVSRTEKVAALASQPLALQALSDLDTVKFTKRSERAFFGDILLQARLRGTEDLVPGLAQRLASATRDPGLLRRLRRWF
jgi:hypothetical protein